ncbi:hypothetical protein [Phyllobacterium salinisoli]|uniref:hypothetical protein n=1 Tax=Phyllobacterium salinisoli TaxID=1899321 RepID=UPI00135A01EE|nr:hypothetical protein [Phyllobacterium salinisoli]
MADEVDEKGFPQRVVDAPFARKSRASKRLRISHLDTNPRILIAETAVWYQPV